MVSERRFADFRISLCVADVDQDAKGRPEWRKGSDELLLQVGGCWDRKRGRWLAKGEKRPPSKRKPQKLVMRFHRGQEDAVRWFAEWLRRFAANDWDGVERVWSAMLIGGRRSGKTHVLCAIMVVFAVMVPGCVLWAISPTLDTGDELDQAFREQLPKGWYKRKQAKTGRSTTYVIANGDRKGRRASRILLKSGVNPDRLKAGRVDIAFLNEAQEISRKAYIKLRAPIADKGGIVVLAANPPDKPIGRWVKKMFFAIRAKKIDAIAWQLNPNKNPFINLDALTSMRKELDPEEYDSDVLGHFVAIGDAVFKNWSDEENVKYPSADLIDITAKVLRRALGHAAGYVVGQDFQKTPAMVGIVHKVFLCPKTGEEFLWVVDEAIAEDTDENGLVDKLESMPVWRPGDGAPEARTHEECYRGWVEDADPKDEPRHCAGVIDASGFFQDGAHNKGKTSDAALKARRWTHLFKPLKDSDKNPEIIERMKAGRRLILAADGKRRLFVAPHCTQTIEALQSYENDRNGVPNRRSEWAHIVDGVTYVGYRIYGRPVVQRTLEYRSAGKREDRGAGW